MIGLKSTGSWKNTHDYLDSLLSGDIYSDIQRYAIAGVDALSNATPRDTGLTAESWNYKIQKGKGNIRIEWFNNHLHNGVNIAILIQYGHGTGTGGYVTGYDYINPAIRPIFDKIIDDVWEKVRNG